MTQCLFVYGTLGPGRPNEHILSAIGGIWKEASVNGYLKPQGWGAKMGYPGMVLDDTGDEIKGHIFCSDKLDYHWDKLDEFEGEEYKRVLIKVKTKDKMAVEAYIYVLRESSNIGFLTISKLGGTCKVLGNIKQIDYEVCMIIYPAPRLIGLKENLYG